MFATSKAIETSKYEDFDNWLWLKFLMVVGSILAAFLDEHDMIGTWTHLCSSNLALLPRPKAVAESGKTVATRALTPPAITHVCGNRQTAISVDFNTAKESFLHFGSRSNAVKLGHWRNANAIWIEYGINGYDIKTVLQVT